MNMTEYLAGLRIYGHAPERIGEVKIGRTTYAAGQFHNSVTDSTTLALMPLARNGVVPNMLPASYLRSSKIIYTDGINEWYTSGWHTGRTNKICAQGHDGVLWLNQLDCFPHLFDDYRRFRMRVNWTESLVETT